MQDTYYARACDKGVFTASGDELNVIRDGIEIAGTIMQKPLIKIIQRDRARATSSAGQNRSNSRP